MYSCYFYHHLGREVRLSAVITPFYKEDKGHKAPFIVILILTAPAGAREHARTEGKKQAFLMHIFAFVLSDIELLSLVY